MDARWLPVPRLSPWQISARRSRSTQARRVEDASSTSSWLGSRRVVAIARDCISGDARRLIVPKDSVWRAVVCCGFDACGERSDDGEDACLGGD